MPPSGPPLIIPAGSSRVEPVDQPPGSGADFRVQHNVSEDSGGRHGLPLRQPEVSYLRPIPFSCNLGLPEQNTEPLGRPLKTQPTLGKRRRRYLD